MLNAISEQDRLKLNRQLIIASHSSNFFLVKKLISKGADPNCRYDGFEDCRLSSNYGIDSTPLIMAIRTYKLSLFPDFENMRQTVHTLLKNGANPSMMDKLQRNALYYAIECVRMKPHRTMLVEVVRDMVSYMKPKDLDITIRWHMPMLNKYHELSLIEFTLVPIVFSPQYEIAKILLNAGADPNFINKNSMLKNNQVMFHLNFVMFCLAKGLRFNTIEKERLSENSVLEFFVRSEVEFSGFFQNVKDDAELIDGLIKIKKCIRFKAQELAFSTWLKYGIKEFLSNEQQKSNIVINFLKQKTSLCIIPVADTVQRYLNADNIKSLFFVLVGLDITGGAHKKEISELIETFKANIIDLDQYIRINFITKSSNRKNNRNFIEKASEESLKDVRFLYKEEQRNKKYEEEQRDKQSGFDVYVHASIYCSFIASLYCALVTCSVAAIITAAIIGAAVGYGAMKLYEKVSEEKSKNPSMGTWTALTNVLTPKGFKGKSIPEPAILDPLQNEEKSRKTKKSV
ncbi:MAG TPA: hypothetical protein DEQ74_02700 [Wolbachia sp.]|uniref:hypothetical protein n=1 Tax=Wolbachia endosymbiont of Pentalonia nigronervosa TaxID=1301914 RepID=UPI000EEDF854|nr:hypothetical protein [Wolbachia endosymbiont of Pentalonia nigronervosa]MBD0391512.1 hypothetical protein [Wolbachia endosymbiont of Pentalonia nigronervosa]HCE59717.1 hypothetical protein [Wolbachia sp.]